MLLCDFHIHSTFSDGRHTVRELVDYYGHSGFDCIAITDHWCDRTSFLGKGARILDRTLTPETFPAYLGTIQEENERALRLYGMHVLAGVEITRNYFSNARSAHYIGVGISEAVNPELTIEEGLRALRQQGAITIAAHPVSNGKLEKQTLHLWDRREELRTLFDAWEVGSGEHWFPQVFQSGLPMVASTDLHRLNQIGGWKSLVRSASHPEAILEAVRSQKIEFRRFQPRASVDGFAWACQTQNSFSSLDILHRF